VQNGHGRPLRILEIGSWAGASAVSWAKGLQALGIDGTVLCLDRWEPYFDTRTDSAAVYVEMNEAAKSGAILELFHHNLRTCGVGPYVQFCRGEVREVAPTLASGTFDIIYLDGSHRYDDVMFDLHEAARLVANDGIVCGDDLELQQHELAADERPDAVTASIDYVWLQSKQLSYHPGVTKAVAETLGPVTAWNGFWAARKAANGWTPVELDLRHVEIPAHLSDDLASEQADEQLGLSDRSVPTVTLIGETPHYNIVQADDRFLAVAKSVGPVKLFHDRLGEQELGSVVLLGSSAAEVQARTQAYMVAPLPVATLIGETSQYNIVQADDRFLAVAKSLGPIDLFNDRIGEHELGNLVLLGSSAAEVSARAEAQERLAVGASIIHEPPPATDISGASEIT
jgi:predicted O-methyltransferase YrrM